jgi:hypothetical protein
MEMLINMSKAQKRGNREGKKPEAIKISGQPATSTSLTKEAVLPSVQPTKKR